MPNDPVAARSPTIFKLTSCYMRRYMRRNFHAVRISKTGPARLPPNHPAIVYCNHPAWWDPVFLMVLAKIFFPARPGYGPIDSTALTQYGFMRRIGFFGVEPDTRRGATQFMRAGLDILQHTEAMLWVTAEGEFTDTRVRPVRLQPGVAALAQKARDVVCIPLAIEYSFWNERYPEALCRFGKPLAAGEIKNGCAQLEARLTETMDRLAKEVMTRDPANFNIIVKGSVGIGGIYDTWRRLKAVSHRRRFNPAHDDID